MQLTQFLWFLGQNFDTNERLLGSPDKFKNINVVLRKPYHLWMDENLILNLCKDSEPVQMCRCAPETKILSMRLSRCPIYVDGWKFDFESLQRFWGCADVQMCTRSRLESEGAGNKGRRGPTKFLASRFFSIQSLFSIPFLFDFCTLSLSSGGSSSTAYEPRVWNTSWLRFWFHRDAMWTTKSDKQTL